MIPLAAHFTGRALPMQLVSHLRSFKGLILSHLESFIVIINACAQIQIQPADFVVFFSN